MSPTIRQINHLRIDVKTGGILLDGYDHSNDDAEPGEPKLSMRFDDYFERDIRYLLANVMLEISDVFRSSPLMTLVVIGEEDYINEDFLDVNVWRTTLYSFPLLERLEFRGRPVTIALFEALGSAPPQGADAILCPRLKKLYLDTEYSGIGKVTITAMHNSLAYRQAQGMRLQYLSLRPQLHINKRDLAKLNRVPVGTLDMELF
ncbi:hypothetical protein SCP_0806090 [Sparassis crispa]|uniref:Uncharacterized protein n=1 Tax=Sparassis crispa TaxID=139825 RepID=A0A401GV34_9APHY|nr:hypothetical protein SCP_0806090 [Sparassis crispa]GBE86085.1 hypothetical protein SCP_0806090 [Sparassis crispa]